MSDATGTARDDSVLGFYASATGRYRALLDGLSRDIALEVDQGRINLQLANELSARISKAVAEVELQRYERTARNPWPYHERCHECGIPWDQVSENCPRRKFDRHPRVWQ
jgi:hypothetical protein